nr:hypothetical protein [Kribbella speibonae]
MQIVREKFRLTQLVMDGDRGMITSARIDALADKTDLGWLTALRAPAIKALAATGGPLQPTLFDTQDPRRDQPPRLPRRAPRRVPQPVPRRRAGPQTHRTAHRHREHPRPVIAAVTAGRLTGSDQIGLKVGPLINKYKMAKHLEVTITDTSLAVTRKTGRIEAEAALDGVNVIRTTVPADTLDAAVWSAPTRTSHVERDFRNIKVDDLDLRPIYHRLEDRVRAHMFIAMLAAYLT